MIVSHMDNYVELIVNAHSVWTNNQDKIWKISIKIKDVDVQNQDVWKITANVFKKDNYADKNAPVRIVKILPEVNNDNFNSIFISF